jgi:hypothetical protein
MCRIDLLDLDLARSPHGHHPGAELKDDHRNGDYDP